MAATSAALPDNGLASTDPLQQNGDQVVLFGQNGVGERLVSTDLEDTLAAERQEE